MTNLMTLSIISFHQKSFFIERIRHRRRGERRHVLDQVTSIKDSFPSGGLAKSLMNYYQQTRYPFSRAIAPSSPLLTCRKSSTLPPFNTFSRARPPSALVTTNEYSRTREQRSEIRDQGLVCSVSDRAAIRVVADFTERARNPCTDKALPFRNMRPSIIALYHLHFSQALCFVQHIITATECDQSDRVIP